MGVARGLARIVSGGQSGVDRAGLDFAIRRGLDYFGWCPQDGWAEDCPDPPGLLAKYPRMKQTPSADPKQRTRWNVRDSDGTLVIVASEISVSPGSAYTIDCARARRKPHLVTDLRSRDAVFTARDWIAGLEAGALNIAGPRESEWPGIYAAALDFLQLLF